MGKRLVDFFRSDLGVLVLVAATCMILHIATNGKYGFHRDELQTLDDARHLDWGFVVYPPITPLIGRVELILFGTSLIGFRFFDAVAVSIVMVLTGLMARELGGSRHIQLLAAIAAGVAPISLVQGAVHQYVAFDYLWGVTITYLLVRLLKSEDPRWWVPIGAVLGLGMETRYTMGFLALGIVGAVLLTPARRFLKSGWLWAGVGISVLIFLPNVIWQAQHHFISFDFLSRLHARDLRQGRYQGFYREQLLICVNIVTAPLTLLGLWFYLFYRESRRYRLLGWTFIVTFALFAIAGARSYYTAPIYPMLLAGGSVLFGIWLARLRPAWSRAAFGAQWTAIFVNGVISALLFLPVAPIGSPIWKITSKMYDQFREEIGWPELAQAVAGVYNSLPAAEREHTGILTGNYGEGGALNLYGPPLGLPHAMCLTNSFWYRGFDPRLPQTVIVAGFDLDEAEKLFESCTVAAKNTNPFGVENEESRDHPDILLCRNLRMPWPLYWQRSRRFG
ncbi:MAG TPA: glycosyltransferase family 39 protein [Candidatus Acidoferrum sp.]|nr:glycosyltransferase family 39 protein [Candidatus Acidoferrum sp.]